MDTWHETCSLLNVGFHFLTVTTVWTITWRHKFTVPTSEKAIRLDIFHAPLTIAKQYFMQLNHYRDAVPAHHVAKRGTDKTA